MRQWCHRREMDGVPGVGLMRLCSGEMGRRLLIRTPAIVGMVGILLACLVVLLGVRRRELTAREIPP